MVSRFLIAQFKVVMKHCKFTNLIFMAVAASITPTAESSTRQTYHAPSHNESASSEPIMAIVSIESQQVTLYDADGQIQNAPVSTGTYGRETPAGIFAVVEKKKEHRSNMYDDAKMPNMHRITWNGIALHGGPLPGYPASHGCVRLPYGFARELFGKTRIGMRVIISPSDTAPIGFSHPVLFTPNADAVAAAPGRADTLAHEAKEAVRAAREARKTSKSMVRKVRKQKRSLRNLKWRKKRADTQLRRADKKLSAADLTMGRAGERQQKAADKAEELTTQYETAKATNDASQTSIEAEKVKRTTAREVALLKATLRKLDKSKKRTEAKLRSADKALSAAEQTWERAGERQRKATERAIELAQQLETTKAANDAAQVNLEAQKVTKTPRREEALRNASLRKLEKRRKKAGAQLKHADKKISAAAQARQRADEKQRSAAEKDKELRAQIDIVKPDLKAKVAAIAAAKDAYKAARIRESSLRKLKSNMKKAVAQLERTDKALSAADKTKLQAEERQRKAADKAKSLATQVDTAKSVLKETVASTAAANDAYKAARIRKAETAKAAYEAKLALEPVSVYISLPAQKIYVRRNTHKPARDGGGEVFDTSIEADITIRDPYMPIGTHVFTAMEQNDVGLHWTAVTIDDADDARSALDRITIPQDVLDRIEPTALPRSSIIISDEPLSEETNYRTEFVAVLSNQPQGGFITRQVDQNSDEENEDEDETTQWQGNSMFDPLNDY
jgi:hypothetical protein